MNRTFRSVVSLILCASLVFCTATVCSGAGVSKDVGEERLRELFIDGECGKLDYGYYSPVTGSEDSTEYPVVVILHGLFNGFSKRSQINGLNFIYWASSEIQQRFKEGGAHIIIPRIPEYALDSYFTDDLQKLVADYVEKNCENVNEKEIYILGSSSGGIEIYRVLYAYPKYYAAAVILCALAPQSADNLKKAADTPIWLISSSLDPIANPIVQSLNWSNIVATNSAPEKCRWTRFRNLIYTPEGKFKLTVHRLSCVLGFDFTLMNPAGFSGRVEYDGISYPGTYTVDGKGNSVSAKGFIDWFENCIQMQ